MMMIHRFFQADLEPPAWLYAHLARRAVFSRIYRFWADDLVRILPPEGRLLDVGTGPGYLLDHLAAKRPDLKLVGLDPSLAMLQQGRCVAGFSSQTPFLGVVGRAQVLPFAPQTFHQVVATFSLHHWRQPAQGITEILRVLKPNAKAWIYELNPDASLVDLRCFARNLKLPYLLVYPVYRATTWHSALGVADFTAIMKASAVSKWHLKPAHHIFWQLEIEKSLNAEITGEG